MNGKIMYSDYREGSYNLLSPEESKKSLKLAIDAWNTRSSLASKIGRGKYALAEYEKVKRITIPLGKSHILYITTEVQADHTSIISKILELPAQTQNY
jgi:hypothetical protein